MDERTRAALKSPDTSFAAFRAFQVAWNEISLVPLKEDGTCSPSIERIVDGLKKDGDIMTPSPALFTTMAATLRKEIPLAGLRGYDLAIRTATQQITPIALQTTLARMTPAEKNGFTLGTALKMGVQHPTFQSVLYNIASKGTRASVGADSSGINLYGPGVTFTPDQIAAMTAAYNASQNAAPAAPGTVAGMQQALQAQMAAAAMAIATGKPPANAQDAAAQTMIAKLVTGAALGVSMPLLGTSLIVAAGPIIAKNQVIATGMQAVGAPVSTGIFARLLAWFKSLIHPTATTVPPTPLSLAAPTIKPKITA